MKLFDLHAHILPGVDDGPATVEETVATLRVAWEGGTRGVVATSHMHLQPLHTPLERLRQVFEETSGELARLAREREECAFLSEMRLWLGAENYVSTELILALDSGEVLPLGDGSGLLIEFNPYLSFGIMKSALEKVLDRGFTPVLAHVERYRIFQRSSGRLEELVAMGCRAQVNAESLLGSFTSPVRRLVVDFLKRGLIDVVASDMHNADRRRSRLGEAAKVLVKRFPEETVRAWVEETPRTIVETPRT